MGLLLEGKVAVVYGGSGSIGGAIARGFGREGARVFLAGRTAATLEAVADDIRADGGTAKTAVVDALDERAVDAYVDGVVANTGRLDVSCNVIGYRDVQQPLDQMSVEDFLQPVITATRTQFLTARAATRHMATQGSGVILAFGGTGNPLPGLGGFLVSLDAVESLRRQWSCEFGPRGVRFVSLKTGGVLESIPDGMEGRDAIVASIESASPLGRAATLADVGDVAAFVASDRASTMTAATVNISCGAIVDY